MTEKLSASKTERLDGELGEVSDRNIRRELGNFMEEAVEKGIFDSAESAEAAVMDEALEIKNRHFYTINMAGASILRLIETGKVETFWDQLDEAGDVQAVRAAETANGKAIGEDYAEFRRAAEEGMRQFVAPEEVKTERPVYVALGSNGEDFVKGVAPAYGNWNVVFGTEKEQSMVYSYTDSFQAVGHEGMDFDDKYVLDLDGACVAKAIHGYDAKRLAKDVKYLPDKSLRNRNRAGYVEGAVFDEMKLEDVGAIVCDIGNVQELNQFAEMMPKIAGIKDKLKINCDEPGDLMLAMSYLRRNFEVFGAREETDGEELEAEMWAELEVEPTASMQEISTAIDERAQQLWKTLSFGFEYKNRMLYKDFLGRMGWKEADRRTFEPRRKIEEMRKMEERGRTVPRREEKERDWETFRKIVVLKKNQALFGSSVV